MKKQSVYTILRDSLVDERLPHNFRLPREETAPNEIDFMVGAKDGIGVFHSAQQEPEKVVEKILDYLKSGETEKIAPVVIKNGVLHFIDPLLSAIQKNENTLDPIAVRSYAESLAFESEDEELVKLGIAMLSLFNWRDPSKIQEKLITLGLYEEFTLYVVATAQTWENGNDAVFKIARSVDGWGKIHAVERLKPETDAIRDWILRQGCENAVTNAYLGLECANKGNLIDALRRDSLDPELYESISIIIDALMDEGPVEGISAYKYAEEALARYLQFSEKYAVTLKHLWFVLNVETSINDLELSNKDELLRLCSAISSRPVWRELIVTTLSEPENDNFFYANNSASRLNIDVTDLIYAAVKKYPVKNSWYLSKVYKKLEYAKELTALYESILPLEEMATGMGDHLFATTFQTEHNCLDLVLQELREYPKMGEALVKTALGSPVVRERNGACTVLEAWSEKLRQSVATFSPSLYELLKSVSSREVNNDTKKTMLKLLTSAQVDN